MFYLDFATDCRYIFAELKQIMKYETILLEGDVMRLIFNETLAYYIELLCTQSNTISERSEIH